VLSEVEERDLWRHQEGASVISISARVGTDSFDQRSSVASKIAFASMNDCISIAMSSISLSLSCTQSSSTRDSFPVIVIALLDRLLRLDLRLRAPRCATRRTAGRAADDVVRSVAVGDALLVV
jgi:hypothetical protein